MSYLRVKGKKKTGEEWRKIPKWRNLLMGKECLSFFILKSIRGTANQNEMMHIIFRGKG